MFVVIDFHRDTNVLNHPSFAFADIDNRCYSIVGNVANNLSLPHIELAQLRMQLMVQPF